jgi:uncharacterized protein YbgA (DUF1722 family)
MEQWQRRWAENKYWVMAHSQQIYNEMRQLAKDNDWSAEKNSKFEVLLRVAAQQTPTVKTLTTAYQHVWGYFKKICTPIEKAKYLKLLQQLDPMNDLLGPFLKQMAVKYQIEYLVNSRIIREL